MSQADEEALDWFVRRADGLAAADEARFRQWLAAHPDHARAYARWQQDWQAIDVLPADAVDRLKRGIAAGSDAGTAQARASEAGTAGRRRFASWFAPPRTIVAAAGLALALACGLASALWCRPLSSTSLATARGERIDTILADRSRLQLAPDSHATVDFYRTRREIALSRGQGRFEVRRDPERPLTVLAGPLRITVVGTRFAVHHTSGPQGGVRIAVEEGRVHVARAGWLASSGEAVDLSAGQAVGSDASGVLGSVSAVLPADFAPWQEQRASFENATLAQVLAAFERHGDTGLVVRDPSVAAMRLTGTFDLRRPDQFAQLLPRALPVRLARVGGSTEIRMK
jgi:transmembrane sensor